MTDELNDVQEDIESYLFEQVEEGQQYFKSKYIAEDLDLTSKTVGTNLGFLQDMTTRVVIESWSGGSSGRTWRITAPEDAPSSPVKETDAERPRLALVSDD
jgi:hypothetical protein